jgi:flagellum-specific ATP synthase
MSLKHQENEDFLANACVSYLRDCAQLVRMTSSRQASGRLVGVSGLLMQAVGMKVPMGTTCLVDGPDGVKLEAEVVGFDQNHLLLMPYDDVHGVVPNAHVYPVDVERLVPGPGQVTHPRRRSSDRGKHLPGGNGLLGRVVDSQGNPLDGRGSLLNVQPIPLRNRPYNPMLRAPIREPIDVGIRAINGMLTIGRGQRVGLFAGSGVGKSVLLGMMARYSSADIIVVGLIGERGREVKEFIEEILGREGLERAVVVAAPADTSPLSRMQGAAYATAVAEHFRDLGKSVLLIMDSLTRYAMAQREIALSVGEPPATKGYPPSVFAKLPQLVERAGNGRPGGGSITAFYTVLTEGDDQQDPIADAARAILDGHIVLSRSLAEAGHYPAIDIEASVSRLVHQLLTAQELEQVFIIKRQFSKYQQSRDLIMLGGYSAGNDPELDRAIAQFPDIEKFLRQNITERGNTEDTRRILATLAAAATKPIGR